jgi:hypothetical protein
MKLKQPVDDGAAVEGAAAECRHELGSQIPRRHTVHPINHGSCGVILGHVIHLPLRTMP